jgi:hypothetical protein
MLEVGNVLRELIFEGQPRGKQVVLRPKWKEDCFDLAVEAKPEVGGF